MDKNKKGIDFSKWEVYYGDIAFGNGTKTGLTLPGINNNWFERYDVDFQKKVGKNWIFLSIILADRNDCQYGDRHSSKIISDPVELQRIYDQIQKELFMREELNR